MKEKRGKGEGGWEGGRRQGRGSRTQGEECRAVTCQRIATVNSRHDSFKISAECKDVGDMYNPELWLEGAFVRRFYEPRKAGFSGTNVNAAGLPAGALNAPASGMRAQV